MGTIAITGEVAFAVCKYKMDGLTMHIKTRVPSISIAYSPKASRAEFVVAESRAMEIQGRAFVFLCEVV
jgi:hypothetical protein